MTARWITADVFTGLATLETGSVDLVVTSPPFLALRSYLPADHADKSKEIGSEATPAEFVDTMLRVTAELRRVLAPHGSICVELGDTYAAGGSGLTDYADQRGNPDGMRDTTFSGGNTRNGGGDGWPLAKSRTLIPSLYQIALAYGFNPLTGLESPAGQWRIRNVVTWARPNPPVGALGDKWRPATSDLIVACTSSKRYWDDLATRKEFARDYEGELRGGDEAKFNGSGQAGGYDPGVMSRDIRMTHSGAPLLDYWVIPPGGYTGAHYAVFPEELVVPCVKAMCPPKVCRTCGEPSRRITETTYERSRGGTTGTRRDLKEPDGRLGDKGMNNKPTLNALLTTTGWTDCGHDTWRPGLVLDPFAGSGTTLAVATGHGHDAIGIDLDERNAELARDRVGPFLFEMVDA